MKVPRSDIASAIATHTYSDGVQQDYARQVAAYLIDRGRVSELDSLLRDISADWAQHGFVEVLTRTAHSLTADAKQQITDQVARLYPKAESIKVTEIPDASVVGGVQISVANRVLDLSVEAKLNKFKQL